MGKFLYIAEKPSVAREFGKALHEQMKNHDGYMEGASSVVTWCVGHLVSMSYPEAYDPELKRWRMETLPFFPPKDEYKYEIIDGVKKQFAIVSSLLNREDVSRIYVCTDSGREGEYIYRLVAQEAHVTGKEQRRVWIDSQTEEEIRRGIDEAKDLSAYDNLSASAYLRAREDYLMGINFSRLLTLAYGGYIKSALSLEKNVVIAVGRVMTCVLGMVVTREREIRNFQKTPFYRVVMRLDMSQKLGETGEVPKQVLEAEWRAVKGSAYFESPLLYKENGCKQKNTAEELIGRLMPADTAFVDKIEKKKEKKNPPLLYNLAELQNDCSRFFKISPDETLKVAQELYEKKLTTYPRTDARVLSTAIAKEIHKNIEGLKRYTPVAAKAEQILSEGLYKTIAKTKYTNDKLITDHYAIIPTGQGLGALSSCHDIVRKVYHVIVIRFLSIFYPPAEFDKLTVVLKKGDESFFTGFKVLASPGYMTVTGRDKKFRAQIGDDQEDEKNTDEEDGQASFGEEEKENVTTALSPEAMEELAKLKKGDTLPVYDFKIREGETAPPKRYNSGSLILAMENAGKLIEDEELREQIKGSGIGTSATRAEILNKLVTKGYLKLAKKTQIVTPECLGEMVYEVVNCSVRPMLNAEFTASWEKGLTMVASGDVTDEEYMRKLKAYIVKWTDFVKGNDANARRYLNHNLSYVRGQYPVKSQVNGKKKSGGRKKS